MYKILLSPGACEKSVVGGGTNSTAPYTVYVYQILIVRVQVAGIGGK